MSIRNVNVDRKRMGDLVPRIPRCWDCRSYPRGGRSRGHCVLLGQMVRGATENRSCFSPHLNPQAPPNRFELEEAEAIKAIEARRRKARE